MKTNQSHIQSLSPEDLSRLLFRIWYDGYEQGFAQADHISSDTAPSQLYPSTPGTYLSWLQQPYMHSI